MPAQQRKRTRANGEGSIYRDAERKRWIGVLTTGYDDAGKQVRRKVSGRTKEEVTRKLDELRVATRAGMSPARADLTVAKYMQSWLDGLEAGAVRPLTVSNYRTVTALYIVPFVGQVRLAQLRPEHVERMVVALAKGDPKASPPRQPLSPNTQRAARSVLRRALRSAQQRGLVTQNVAQIAEGPKDTTTVGRTLTVEQARALLTSLEGDRYQAPIVLALTLGLRRGELLGLAWPDVDLEGAPHRLTVSRSLKRIPGKRSGTESAGLVLDDPKTKASRRTVHLPPETVATLKAHRAAQAAERLKAGQIWTPLPLGADLMFRTPFGLAVDPDNFRHAVYRATERAGIGRWSPHELRHSAASLLIAQGHPLKLISELLGHSSIRVTADVYGHLLEEGKASTAAAMGAVLYGEAK